MSALLAIVLGLLSFVAAGRAFVRRIDSSFADSSIGTLGLGLIVGPGLVAFAAFTLNALGVRFSPLLSYAILGAIVLVSAFDRVRARPAFETPATQELGPLLARLSCVLIALVVAFGAVFAAVTPAIKDSLVNWSYKTLVLFEDGTLHTDDLRAEHRHIYHPNYPLLVPIVQVYLFGLANSIQDQLAKITFALPHLGLALIAFAEFRRRTGPGTALLLAALLATTPHFYRVDDLYRFAGSIPSGYADPMFASLAGACVITAIAWLRTQRTGDLVATMTCLALAIFTKNESLPFAIALFAGLGSAALLRRLRGLPWPRPKQLLVASLPLLFIAIPWFLVRSTLPERDENYQHSLTLANLAEGAWRLPLVLAQSVQSAFSADFYGFIWPLLLITAIVHFRRLLEPHVVLALTVLLAMATVYAAVFIVTPLPIVDSLVTSIPRTFFQMSPVCVALIGALLSDRSSNATDSPRGDDG